MDKITKAQQRVLELLGKANTYEEVITIEKQLTVELNVNRLLDMIDGYLQSAVTDRISIIRGETEKLKEV